MRVKMATAHLCVIPVLFNLFLTVYTDNDTDMTATASVTDISTSSADSITVPMTSTSISMPTNTSNIQWFGHADVAPSSLGSKLVPGGSVAVFLPVAVQSEGELIGFSAYIREPLLFYFQVYRPSNSSSRTLQVIFSMPVTPSVVNQKEEFYIQSFFTYKCVRVVPGDRLGLYFTAASTYPPVVNVFTGVDSPQNVQLSSGGIALPVVGSTVSIQDVNFVYEFFATGYIYRKSYSPEERNSIEQNCTKGISARSTAPSVTVSTTTYLPPTGIQGATGWTGPEGDKGPKGVQGFTGEQGPVGYTGPQGLQGVTGHQGFTGQPGPQGDNGTTGENGTIGQQGSTGETGFMGYTGAIGPQGPAGMNLTVHICGPFNRQKCDNYTLGEMVESLVNGEFWSQDMSVEAMYIWLPIATFVAIIGFIILVVDCCLDSQVKRHLANQPGTL